MRAGLAEQPDQWPWSSARAHLMGKDDGLAKVRPLLDRVLYGWDDFLTLPVARSEVDLLRRHERTGRPLGARDFVAGLEARLGRRLGPMRPGPKKGET